MPTDNPTYAEHHWRSAAHTRKNPLKRHLVWHLFAGHAAITPTSAELATWTRAELVDAHDEIHLGTARTAE